MALLSILALYNYDETIFDGLELPTAADITDDAEKVDDPWIPDKDDFVAYLCMQAAELELVYASAPVMAAMIGVWSKAHRYEWVQLYNTMLYKYNPIWNKDGEIEEMTAGSGTSDRTPELTTTDTRTYTNLRDVQTGSVEHDVTGYDVNTYSPNTRDVSNELTNTRNGEDKNVEVMSGLDRVVNSETGRTTRKETGNIGVTMTQEMIQRQREIVQFNLYDFIAKQFIHHFCLQVY